MDNAAVKPEGQGVGRGPFVYDQELLLNVIKIYVLIDPVIAR